VGNLDLTLPPQLAHLDAGDVSWGKERSVRTVRSQRAPRGAAQAERAWGTAGFRARLGCRRPQRAGWLWAPRVRGAERDARGSHACRGWAYHSARRRRSPAGRLGDRAGAAAGGGAGETRGRARRGLAGTRRVTGPL
jgi:hypothetical protein